MEKEAIKTENLLTEEYAEVNYIPEMTLAYIKWKGNVSVDQYRNAFETVYKYALAGNLVTRFYSDTREQGVVGPENRKWFEKEMLPKAIDQGLKKAGVVSDANVFKRYYLNMILKSVNKFNVPFKICKNDEEVISYLMED